MSTEDDAPKGVNICSILFGAVTTFRAKQGFGTNVHLNFLLIHCSKHCHAQQCAALQDCIMSCRINVFFSQIHSQKIAAVAFMLNKSHVVLNKCIYIFPYLYCVR